MARPSSSKRSTAVRAASAADRDEREQRLQQAAVEVRQGAHDSIRKAAAAHNVPESTLRTRLAGTPPKKDAQVGQQSLTPAAESALVEHIRRCAYSGYPLTPANIREYANTISRRISGRVDAVDVGRNWLQGFLLRHPTIRSHWSRCLDNARLKGTDEEGIRSWFARFAAVVRDFSVSSGNIYNMDETGFMFGQGNSERVLVPADDKAARFKAQPGSRESATVVECIGSGGQVLPPLVITKGVVHTIGDHRRMQGVPSLWYFSKSTNGWTSDALAVEWLDKVFDPNTTPSTPSTYRLLIMDGHTSHISDAIIDVFWSRRIVPLLLPAHSTHVMQPLDVSIFGPLTAAYRHIINDVAHDVSRDIDRAEFATIYAQARSKVLTPMAARKAFVDTGMTVDPDPDKVLCRLPGYAAANRPSLPSRSPLQEIDIPQSNAAVNAMLNAYRSEPMVRQASQLKRSLLSAYEAPQATISVLQAENMLLRSQEEQRRRKTQKVKRKDAVVDKMVLSKDKMITREYAERELVAKEPAMDAKRRKDEAKKRREEEERAVVSTAVAVDDGEEAVEDGDERVSSPSGVVATPAMPRIDDNLDDGEPLSAISDDDDDPYGFFETLPVAGPSRSKR